MDKKEIYSLVNAFFNGDFDEEKKEIRIKITKNVSTYDNFNEFSDEIVNEYKESYDLNFNPIGIEGDLTLYPDKKKFEISTKYKFSDINIESESDVFRNIQDLHKEDKNIVNKAILNSLIIRSSKDKTRGFLTIDWKSKKKNKEYLLSLMNLLNTSSNIHMFDLNYRELQKNSKNKNTQLRVSAKYTLEILQYDFVDKNTLSFIENNFDLEQDSRKLNFWENFDRFLSIIEVDELSADDIENLRETYGYSVSDSDETLKRAYKIKELAKRTLENICFGCADSYNLNDRTFKCRGSENYYLEIHHVIPWSSQKKINDNISNLVKLCPTCHRALTKGRAEEDLQKDIITNICKNSNNIENFLSEYYPDEKNMTDFIYNSLI